MERQYIIPVIGQIYKNRNGSDFLCTGNRGYENDEQERMALSLGEHWASMKRVKDGWSLIAHGIIQYADSTIEWNYSTKGHFPAEHPTRGNGTII